MFIDPDPKHDFESITDDFEMELYERKNTYFWLILQHSIQNSTAKHILNTFRTLDYSPDARAAFLAIDEQMAQVSSNHIPYPSIFSNSRNSIYGPSLAPGPPFSLCGMTNSGK